ncbi:phage baseplate protein [Ralstonia pseudosolanacearum]|uniref:phage baseplate protein n=1 Tax=Ralstonia pseudosolanacearum TaxID=1310165 RepID=UPI003EE25029
MTSLLTSGLALAAVAATDLVSAIFMPRRSINSSMGTFSAYITLEERHRDELVITDHPVEQGAQISDHAYKKPSEVTITIGWTNSSLASLTSLQFGNYSSYAYDRLLQLQKMRELFSISTGKRRYQNMLIQSIDVTTDAKTENACIATLHCREVIVVQTMTTQLVPAENQAMPQKTGQAANAGTKLPQATNTSLLYRLAN